MKKESLLVGFCDDVQYIYNAVDAEKGEVRGK